MKIISAFPWRRAADTAADVAGDVLEAETAAARSLWASRATVWPAILLLVAFVGVGCFVVGHAVATAGVKRLDMDHALAITTLGGTLDRCNEARKAAGDALQEARQKLAALSPKPHSDAPAAIAPAAAAGASSLPAERPPRRRVKSAVKPAAADGGFIGAMWKTITGG